MKLYDFLYHPQKPEGIEKRKAYIVGGGIAGLAAAAFLVDDAGMPGENITIFEAREDVGGCCGIVREPGAYVCPGERELEPYMECLWYLCSKIPSLEEPGRSVLDETVESNRCLPIHSECRCIQNQGHIWEGIHDFKMDAKTAERVMGYMTEPEKALEDISIEDYFGKGSPFFDSALWWCFHPMLAFKEYHGAIEAKRYFARFGLANRIDYLEGILHTKRNDYDSIVKPLLTWLESEGVHVEYGCKVRDVDLDEACNTATGICLSRHGAEEAVSVHPEDYVFVTNGSMMTNSTFGDNTHAAPVNRDTSDMGLFTVWKNLAAKHPKFGHPEKFLNKIDQTKWMSFFFTVTDYPEFFDRIERSTGSPRGTGGCVTVKDSAWEFSGMFYDRDYFPGQRERNEDVAWFDGLYGERVGDYVKKPMAECNGNEIMTELLYHLGMMDILDEVLAHTHVSLCMMPYITAHFMPRCEFDRPRIVPEGCTNIAFMGQYVEVPGDVSFTIETSVRTPLEAVYALTGIGKLKPPVEVYPSQYDMRYFKERALKQTGMDKEPLSLDSLPKMGPIKLHEKVQEVLDEINNIPPYYVMYQGEDKSVAQKESVLSPEYPKEY